MDTEKALTPSAVKYFRVLMLGLFVLGAVVIFGTMGGWMWFVEHTRDRNYIEKFAAEKEAELKRRAEINASREILATAPAPQDDSDTSPKISLTELARELSKNDSVEDAIAEPITITLPFDSSSPDIQAAEEVLKKYWNTADWRERVPLVYDSEHVKPLMQQHYEKQKYTDPMPGALLNRGRYRLNGTEILHFTYSCSRPGDVLELAMRRNSNGDFVLDWTSYVGFCELSWAEFKQLRPTAPLLFRAFATASDYYNYEFTDEKKYLSISLLSPDGLTTIHGYCERDSPTGTAINRTLGKNQTMTGVIVKLAFPEKAESNRCALITQFVSDRWLLIR
jgi:hypothetical protein